MSAPTPGPVGEILTVIDQATAAYAAGRYAETSVLCQELLSSGRAPAGVRYRLEELRLLSEARLAPLLPAARQAPVTEPSRAAAQLADVLRPQRPTAVVDIGANPIDGDPPYGPMLRDGLCTVVGFEPQPDALDELRRRGGPAETYLPWAVGDGTVRPWHDCAVGGMSSALRPIRAPLVYSTSFPSSARW